MTVLFDEVDGPPLSEEQRRAVLDAHHAAQAVVTAYPNAPHRCGHPLESRVEVGEGHEWLPHHGGRRKVYRVYVVDRCADCGQTFRHESEHEEHRFVADPDPEPELVAAQEARDHARRKAGEAVDRRQVWER